MDNNKPNPNDEVTVGGEQTQRKILPTLNDDGTPALYPVEIVSFRKKPGRPDDQGKETFYYSWTLKVLSGEYKDEVLYTSTNTECRRSWTTKKPLKLLSFVMAIEGEEPAKGSVLKLTDLIGKTLRVELEDKTGADGEPFQIAYRFYPMKPAKAAPKVESVDDEIPF